MILNRRLVELCNDPVMRKPKSKSRRGPKDSPDKQLSIPRGRLLVGIHAVNEAIKVRPHAINELYLKKGYSENADLSEFADWAKAHRIPIKETSIGFFNKICPSHQGICLVVQERPQVSYEELKSDGAKQVMVLDGIEDPHNLGAIVRTAWLMGVSAIFTPSQRSTSLTPTAIKVACGGAEHVPVSEESNLASTLSDLKDMGYWIYALDHRADKVVWQEDFPEKVAWVVGAEGKGVRKPILSASDVWLKIPQIDAEASYNASVAAALALGECRRQQLNLS
ncbi:MAG: 23S rRNA (guanosine(2251)-2'-O)-methyltransferase RlmB [Bdellovibrionaceae bacterium]|nr:23S rRNA (guanosine(2251)-2'-O)-methyltransferase RlmB [Pseudobdellovibrionaceae bacterium]|tara:strand:+ start:14794 stop:15633 length:840 start_codon:yes stop_codon:yes gene_type:complete